MKKIGLICVTIFTCLSLVACGSSSSSNPNSNNHSVQSESVNKFGKPVLLTNNSNGQKVKMTIQSVKQVNPNENMVTDISHNYKQTHQYVIVTYKIKAISNKVNLNDFDGSNLAIYDSKHQSSIASSNRDSVTPKYLHKGEIQVMEIGEGLRTQSSNVTIHFANETWKGPVLK